MFEATNTEIENTLFKWKRKLAELRDQRSIIATQIDSLHASICDLEDTYTRIKKAQDEKKGFATNMVPPRIAPQMAPEPVMGGG